MLKFVDVDVGARLFIESDCGGGTDSSSDVGSDCGGSTSYDSMHTDCGGYDQLEAPRAVPPYVNEQSYVRPYMARSMPVGPNFLVFNPQGSKPPMILSPSAFEIWQNPDAYHQSRISAGKAYSIKKRLVKYGLLVPEENRYDRERRRSRQLTAWLHVTNACNLRCPHCYLHKTPDEMELAHGKLAIDAVLRSAVKQKFTVVKFKYAGGEAALNIKTVLALHEYAQERTAEINLDLSGVVLSNGVGWSDKMIQALQASDLRLMISLDGVGAVHDAQRPFINGAGSFNHVERTLDRLRQHECIPTISITLTSRNLADLPETVRYVLDRNLPFTLNFYRENECSATFSDLQFQEQTIIEAMKRAFKVIEENLPRWSLLGAILDRTRLDVAHDKPCGVGENYLVIDQNGKIAKCQMEIERTITDIYADDPLAELKADLTELQNPSVDEKEGCKSCDWRYWCAGGCPALTFRMTGRFDVKSPNCNIYKALFPEVLRLEGLRGLKYGQVVC